MALVLLGLAVPASAQVADPYLPKSGVIAGRVMELTASAELARATAKMQRAAQRDAAWFKSYVAKASPDQPLPYHQRLGITKAEYDVILNAKMSLRDKGAVSIKVTASEGKVEFAAEGLALNGVRVSAGQKEAETPVGKLTKFSEISQDDAQSPTGRWKGVQWKKEDAPAVTLAIGRRESGDGILYYDVATSQNGPGQTLIVIYRLD
jgi:hypothetical protein